MLKPIQVAAGMGNPPNKWDNQRTEAMNNVLKEEMERQVTDQASIHELIEKRVIKQQESEYKKAIYNVGDYRLSIPYRHLAVSHVEWFGKTDEQRRQYLKKVLNSSQISVEEDTVVTKKLSISVADSVITTVPAGLLNQIWNEAEIILSHNSVIDVGGGVYYVTEHGGSTNVSVNGGSIRCKCRKFSSTAGLCPHVLAVAESNGIFAECLTRFNSCGNKMEKIAFASIPKRAGEKTHEKKKRKGQNNLKQRPVLDAVRPADDNIDFQKPLAFTEIWHNHNKIKIIFTRDEAKATRCESCKVEFARDQCFAYHTISLSYIWKGTITQ